MSLVITVFVPEGIVLAADSRLSLTYETKEGIPQQNYKHTITASDSNDKVFLVKDKFGISSSIAIINHEEGFDNINLYLIKGNKYDGT